MKLRVLVVDDEALSRKVLIMLLQRLGAEEVTVAESFTEAIDLLSKDASFRLVITDHFMPDGRGAHLLGKIRQGALAVAHDTYVVISTTSESFRLQAVALALDADAFLTKPYSKENLAASMLGFMNAKSRNLKPASYYQGLDVAGMVEAAER
jgi:CheY-like chemotaxis protein